MGIQEENTPNVKSKEIEAELSLFETKISDLRVLYEQHFCGLLPLAPTSEHREVNLMSKRLMRLPFRNVQSNFKLKQLQIRLQTLNTHWERVLKQKEAGTYVSDRFKAKMRAEQGKDLAIKRQKKQTKSAGFDDLFSSYKRAMEEQGLQVGSLSQEDFTKDLRKKAELLKQKNGASEVRFRVEIENNKVSIKARCS